MITREQILKSAFPFHILLDHDLRVISLGQSLIKLGYSIENRPKLSDLFLIKTPPTEMELSKIVEQSATTYFLEGLKRAITLKGQMLEVGSHNTIELAFLGSPVLRNMDDIKKLGLKINDFALHDTTLDYLVSMQIQDNVLSDTKQLADKLLKETKARRQVQETLEQTNLSLEDKVQERTEALLKANEKLKLFVERLHTSNNDLRILNETGEELHRCQTVDEAFPLVIKAVQTLFPKSHGYIACYEEKSGYFKKNAEWGVKDHRLGETFSHKDCAAITNDTMYSGQGPRNDSCCPELETIDDEYYFCRPLKFDKSTLGLIHLHCGIDIIYEDQKEWLESRQTLADTLAEHIALAISNIRLRQKLKEESIRDPLTHLFNRRFMKNVLVKEFAKAKRNKSAKFGVILLDVDHFKKFNDTYGHQAGDEALAQLASLLESQIRKGDIVCRYGGEEFLLILGGSSVENTLQRAESIRTAVEKLSITSGKNHQGSISISAGVASFDPKDHNTDDIIRRADNALYVAKEQGRNQVAGPSSM